ncbi:hypothetical protein HYT60_00235 [Candidatus Woesebacteria bacterium]|nr:hypothetical protein [Candidatus Woesebacteria bacterium]
MKIIILHGDHISASYARLSKFIEVAKARGWPVGTLEMGENIEEKLTNASLFRGENFYVIKSFVKLGKNFFNKNAKRLKEAPGNLVIYQEDFIAKDLLSFVPKDAKIEEFKLPRLIFDFLDSFYPGNVKRTLTLLHQVLKNEPPEFVFALLGRHVRDLYWAKTGSPLPLPPWRAQKLKNQAGKFSQGALEEIISRLAETDIKVKTSQAQLTSSLDLMTVTLLK